MNPDSGLGLVRRRWRLMGAILVIAVLIGGLISAATPKRYEATSQLFVSTVLNPNGNLQTAEAFAVARVQSYTSLVDDPDLTTFVVQHLHLKMSAGALGREITASAPINKVLIDITVTDASASRAALIANAVANRFATVTEALENTQGSATSPVVLTLTKQASAPHAPVQPRTKINLAIAFLLGLLLAWGGGLLRARTDDTLRTAEELESLTGCPVLGALPRAGRGSRVGVAARGGGHRAVGTAPSAVGRPDSDLTRRGLELIAAGLAFLEPGGLIPAVVITGVRAGEGATFVATHLAGTLAGAGDDVVLVDANLRAPVLAGMFGLPGEPGLTSAVTGRVPADAIGRRVSDRLTVVPAGSRPPNPGQVAVSAPMAQVLAGLSAGPHYTLLDAAPLLPHGDGVAMAGAVRVTVLVVRAGRTSRKDIAAAMAAFAAAGLAPAAAVLTCAKPGAVRKLLADRGIAVSPVHGRHGRTVTARAPELSDGPTNVAQTGGSAVPAARIAPVVSPAAVVHDAPAISLIVTPEDGPAPVAAQAAETPAAAPAAETPAAAVGVETPATVVVASPAADPSLEIETPASGPDAAPARPAGAEPGTGAVGYPRRIPSTTGQAEPGTLAPVGWPPATDRSEQDLTTPDLSPAR